MIIARISPALREKGTSSMSQPAAVSTTTVGTQSQRAGSRKAFCTKKCGNRRGMPGLAEMAWQDCQVRLLFAGWRGGCCAARLVLPCLGPPALELNAAAPTSHAHPPSSTIVQVLSRILGCGTGLLASVCSADTR